VEDREQKIDAAIQTYRAIAREQFAGSLQAWVELDLSMAQMKTLMVLVDDGPLTIGGVAEKLCVSLPTASHLVDRLVKAELVDRSEDPADRRRAVARLSADGEELLRRLRQGSYSRLHGWLDDLSEDELAALLMGLQALQRVSAAPDLRSVAEVSRSQKTHG
jgi:DNA-binding MarR family transcriptional regulator